MQKLAKEKAPCCLTSINYLNLCFAVSCF
uniref:Uncharacterized protein n=1 Tax=Rhizophora mucronata TaxID=61149 RepID=A0A2P2N111_RHIMU